MRKYNSAYGRIMAERRRKQRIKQGIVAVAYGLALIAIIACFGAAIKGETREPEETVITYPQYTQEEWEQIQREKAAYEEAERAEAEALRETIDRLNEEYMAQKEAEFKWAMEHPDEAYSFVEKVDAEETKTLIHSRDWDADDAYLLAKIAMAEAEDQPTETKALVILTVLNRVWVDEFPGTIEAVIFQKGQFTPISNGRWERVEPNEDCWAALRMVEEGWDESKGALYFETTTKADTWHNTKLTFLYESGDISFYKE